MARVSFQPTPPARFASTLAKRWGPTLGIWGVGAGTAALFLLSVTPVVKKGFLVNIPLIGNYYEDKTPASDKPF
ncbi:ubiquinol-cytochrome-c reductase complex subunit-domain-containing protein [Suillus subluteus]|nr:ubiquinol-cytochrome-c reductase complex subunit-domain-containing protein [Suillus subluteus]